MGDLDPAIAEQQLRKFQKELSAGTVSLALLAVLGAATDRCTATRSPSSSSASAMACSVASRARCIRCCATSSAAGLLDSHVEPSIAGPPRRYYTLTEPAGPPCTNGPPPGAPPAIPSTPSSRDLKP